MPIPKTSSATQVSQFRPISLLSVVSKIMEGILARRISTKAENDKWFKPFMGGFRPRRGTTDQLLSFTHRISKGLSTGQVCATAFLDVSSAYDACFRTGVIAKLIRKGVNGRLLKWLKAFLLNRRARVRFDGERSRFREYKYGLPQGSRLSPILFNIFMSDILNMISLNLWMLGCTPMTCAFLHLEGARLKQQVACHLSCYRSHSGQGKTEYVSMWKARSVGICCLQTERKALAP